MNQPIPTKPRTPRTLLLAGLSAAAILTAAALAPPRTALAAPSAATKPTPAQSILIDALDTELKRAMSSLGSDGAAAATAQQPKPYFLSYSVDDATAVSIARPVRRASSSSNQSHVRSVDVQVRLGSPAEDNTHGDHRTSALTTMPLPLTDDRDAIARTLWFATNRGYGTRARRLPQGQDRAAGPRQGRRRLRRLHRRAAADRRATARARRSSSTAPRGSSVCARSPASSASTPTSTPTRSSSRPPPRPTTSSPPRARASPPPATSPASSSSPAPAPPTAWTSSATRPSRPTPPTISPPRQAIKRQSRRHGEEPRSPAQRPRHRALRRPRHPLRPRLRRLLP